MRDNQPLENLNELEYVDGKIYANIYLTNEIAELDLQKDEVVRVFDFEKLAQVANEMALIIFKRRIMHDECLNGIAYNKDTKTFLITGKHWPVIFEIDLKQ
jgi:glutamine cyclotransferase